MSFSVGLSDASLLDSGLVGISKKQVWGWKITSLPSLVLTKDRLEEERRKWGRKGHHTQFPSKGKKTKKSNSKKHV